MPVCTVPSVASSPAHFTPRSFSASRVSAIMCSTGMVTASQTCS